MPKSNNKYRFIISGGGTGGHIYPAIAIANGLRARFPQAEFLFVGAEGRMEMEKVPRAGYEIVGLPIMGLQRRFTLQNLLLPFKLLKSLSMAKKIVKNFQPDVAIGVGGYASAPLLKKAESLDVPCVIQEQNSYAGLTNKWLAKKVKTICVAYDNMGQYFPKEKIVKTGNPVRSDIIEAVIDQNEARVSFGLEENRKTLLIVGGSLGAFTINETIEKLLPEFDKHNIQVVWQTGKYFFERAKKSAEAYENVSVNEFIYTMDKAYAGADVVISRAGALSISELCLVGKPTILIPSPNVSEDHQTKNAMALVDANSAVLVKDIEAREKLGSVLFDLIDNENKQKELSINIVKLGFPDATDRIVEQVVKLLK
jgi:UDP-N-acetylglucosamine--N-acetylmuramyl-(pentapeptide) pyrophosphoryl-undecaprenol N-acetylglucosamine transferase